MLSSRLHLSRAVDTYIGYDNKYGDSFVHNYSCVDYSNGGLIGERKDGFDYIPCFDFPLLNCMVGCIKLFTSLILLYLVLYKHICVVKVLHNCIHCSYRVNTA